MPNKIIPYNPRLKQLARELRKNSTTAEIWLWQEIKGKALGVEFHRQVPMDEYIVDFYCHELMLAIEVDGDSHHDGEAVEKDKTRQQRLESFGVHFIRFDDRDVKEGMPWVLDELVEKIEILQKANALSPTTSPCPL
jgi:very-short-patch-repair endonuclease